MSLGCQVPECQGARVPRCQLFAFAHCHVRSVVRVLDCVNRSTTSQDDHPSGTRGELQSAAEEQLPMNRLISALCLMIPFALTAFGQQRQTPPDPATDFRVVLLGTGSPTPRPDRSGPSLLLDAGS